VSFLDTGAVIFEGARAKFDPAPGFLGSPLCDRLVEAGPVVVANSFASTKEDIAHLVAHPRFELRRHNVAFPLYVGPMRPTISLPWVCRRLAE
jgi:hypothetical protein